MWQEADPIYNRGLGVELERTCKLIHLVVIEGPGTSRLRIETFRIASPTRSPLASHAGVFRGARSVHRSPRTSAQPKTTFLSQA